MRALDDGNQQKPSTNNWRQRCSFPDEDCFRSRSEGRLRDVSLVRSPSNQTRRNHTDKNRGWKLPCENDFQPRVFLLAGKPEYQTSYAREELMT